MKHVFSSDIDKHARATIKANFEPAVLYEDIHQREHSLAPSCDLYVAGFPCQPFSGEGTRGGFSDPRSRVFYSTP